jgi:hydroxyethylthiazole kinase-like uncharacterized protein yjeF
MNRALLSRDLQGHKGTFGTVVVIGGCAPGELSARAMIGAPALAATAALRAGAGLAQLVMPASLLASGLLLCPSATGWALPEAGAPLDDHPGATLEQLDPGDAIIIGPGLSTHAPARALLSAVLARHARTSGWLVLDADALNLLATLDRAHTTSLGPRCVLTPHPGEFRRLAGALDLPALDPTVPRERPQAAAALARATGATVVLKGHATIIATAHRAHHNATGTHALATGGTGDVLAGLIAGLLAPHAPNTHAHTDADAHAHAHALAFDIACIACHAHGRAAERWCARTGATCGLLARELCDELPGALQELRHT